MAAQLVQRVSVLVVISCFMLMNSCCNATRALKVDADAVTSDWTPAVASWYGEADQGFGSDDGACGYGADVGDFPFSAMVSAGSPSLFLSGKGCGNCYQVRCTTNNACSGSPVSVVITDCSCTDETCASNATDHFDLSRTAFEALANSGQIDELLKAGSIQIEYQKVECSYPGTPLTFKIGSDSNLSNFSVLIEYVPGDGDLAQVDLQQTSVSDSWLPMQSSGGAVWVLSSGSALKGPFSIRITNQASNTLVAENVIPAGWKTGVAYKAKSNVSF